MPLRDHFRPPVTKRASWDALHGQWPANIVKHLRTVLPPGYIAAPTVHHGAFEIDVAASELDDATAYREFGSQRGGTATATWVDEPAVLVETVLADFDEYEVRVYEDNDDHRLVAAIEIASPANKDRPESRNTFIGKCAALLQSGVAVSIVDLVTTKQFNLYAELMEFIGHPDPTMSTSTPHLYAASCRWVRRKSKTYLETWPSTLSLGQPLPKIPLWLAEALVVPLDLEESYEQACRDLWIA
jgi:hypothetical protein